MPKYEIEVTTTVKHVHCVQVEAENMAAVNIIAGGLFEDIIESDTKRFPHGKVYVSPPDTHFSNMTINKVAD